MRLENYVVLRGRLVDVTYVETKLSARLPPPIADVTHASQKSIQGATSAKKQGGDTVAGELNAKSQLAALKSMLEKPHVYGVAERAFRGAS